MPPKFTETVKKGEIFRHEVAGAGGWGDPLERETAAVARDVRNEIVSEKRALEDYGVVLQGYEVDEEATKKKRAEIKRLRGWSELPPVLREKPNIGA